jgi:hypothetical protein
VSTTVAVVLLLAVVAYAIFGGADFGAGFWDLTAGGSERGDHPRGLIEHSIGPVWEANHVWLIFIFVILWTSFPEAYASITLTLFVPLTIAALGIVFRGASFAFRKAVVGLRYRRIFGAAFAASSVLVPYCMGAIAGGIASGRVPAGGQAGDPVVSWINPTSILGGILAVAAVAYLAAVYLVWDARRLDDTAMAEYFRPQGQMRRRGRRRQPGRHLRARCRRTIPSTVLRRGRWLVILSVRPVSAPWCSTATLPAALGRSPDRVAASSSAGVWRVAARAPETLRSPRQHPPAHWPPGIGVGPSLQSRGARLQLLYILIRKASSPKKASTQTGYRSAYSLSPRSPLPNIPRRWDVPAFMACMPRSARKRTADRGGQRRYAGREPSASSISRPSESASAVRMAEREVAHKDAFGYGQHWCNSSTRAQSGSVEIAPAASR